MRWNIKKMFDGLVLGVMTFLTHLTLYVCYLEGITPKRSCNYGSAQGQLSVLFVILVLIFLFLRMRSLERDYWLGWRRNWVLGAFIVFAVLSLFWTVYFPATIYRVLLLLFVTCIAAYVGSHFSARDLLNFVAIMAAVFALASLFVAVAFPRVGIMNNPPYEGLWRGVFWHKIYLGAMMALGYIAYLVILFSPSGEYHRLQKAGAVVLLMLGAVLAVLSDSASGLVVFAVQSVGFALVLAWLKWGHLISRRMYFMVMGLALSAIVLVVSNLGFVFSLFNRSANMTGRIPMWLHVLEAYAAERLVLGHGFGAFWLQPGINQKVQAVVGWGYPVKVADNGYLDTLLGLGGVGLMLLLILLGIAVVRALRGALAGRDLIHFFPLFVLVHIIFINISLSYFMEMESFIWFLFVVVLFMRPDRELVSS
jgi:exopolysaccharide production protein ExoQ